MDEKTLKYYIVNDCAAKVGSWSTAHLAHEDALMVQKELMKIHDWLRNRALAIKYGNFNGIYG